MEIHLKIADYVAELLDNKFRIFNIRVGLDPVLGLVPGLGDLISLVFSCYIIFIAVRLKIPERVINKMIGNIVIDWIVGTVPVIGDLFDIAYKANIRNMALLKQYASY